MKNLGKNVLITGATSGIGYELAKKFAVEGYNLILVARTLSELDKVAFELETFNVNTLVIAKDLFEPDAASTLYDHIKSKGIEVNILVNDAGQGVYGSFVETNLIKQLQIIQLNVTALTTLTYLFLKDMVQRNEGKILQLGSVVSEIPAPLQSVYGATKAFVLSFTEALISEVKDTNITLTVLQPGGTDTDFFNKAGAQNSKIVEDKSSLADPATVAKDGFEALMKGKDKIISGFQNKIEVAISNVLPYTMAADNMKKHSEEIDTK